MSITEMRMLRLAIKNIMKGKIRNEKIHLKMG